MGVTSVTTAGYLGLLFLQNKRPNALLKIAGKFAGATIGEPFAFKATMAREFPIGTFYSLAAPSQPGVLEGANAPAASTTSLTQATNVVQLFQETVSATYLAQSDKTISGVVPIPQGEAQGSVQNPRSTDFQVMTRLQKIAQDANYSFLNGAYVNPADPSVTALGTRGIVTAVTSNVADESGVAGPYTAIIYRGWIDALLSGMVTHNGYVVDNNLVAFAGVTEYSNIAHAYGSLGTMFLQPGDQIAGIQVMKILTTFGQILLVLEPDMPAQRVLIARMDEVGIVGLEVPGKGVIFEEALFKQGSADQTQIYGQAGLDHAPEYYHGLLKTPAGVAIPL
jgi:hypothetical protein